MSHIVLTDEQYEMVSTARTPVEVRDQKAKTITTALEPVQLRDSKGKLLGVINPVWSEEDIAEARRILASDGPWHTFEQVMAHLQSLEKK